jgi:hypothetical protein
MNSALIEELRSVLVTRERDEILSARQERKPMSYRDRQWRRCFFKTLQTEYQRRLRIQGKVTVPKKFLTNAERWLAYCQRREIDPFGDVNLIPEAIVEGTDYP